MRDEGRDHCLGASRSPVCRIPGYAQWRSRPVSTIDLPGYPLSVKTQIKIEEYFAASDSKRVIFKTFRRGKVFKAMRRFGWKGGVSVASRGKLNLHKLRRYKFINDSVRKLIERGGTSIRLIRCSSCRYLDG